MFMCNLNHENPVLKYLWFVLWSLFLDFYILAETSDIYEFIYRLFHIWNPLLTLSEAVL